MTHVALLPAYDFSIWVPEHFLTILNFPETVIHAIVARADKFAHFVGAMVITVLFFGSLADANQANPTIFLGGLFILMLLAEIAQFLIGRSFSILDIVAGVLGSALGLACINYRHARNSLKVVKAQVLGSNNHTRP